MRTRDTKMSVPIEAACEPPLDELPDEQTSVESEGKIDMKIRVKLPAKDERRDIKLWQFLDANFTTLLDKVIRLCKHCGKKYSMRTSTSNLFLHLEKNHKILRPPETAKKMQVRGKAYKKRRIAETFDGIQPGGDIFTEEMLQWLVDANSSRHPTVISVPRPAETSLSLLPLTHNTDDMLSPLNYVYENVSIDNIAYDEHAQNKDQNYGWPEILGQNILLHGEQHHLEPPNPFELNSQYKTTVTNSTAEADSVTTSWKIIQGNRITITSKTVIHIKEK